MTDNSPKAVYLRMLEAYNDGTPHSYGSDKFLEFFSDGAVIEFPASEAGPAARGGKQLFRDGMEGVGALFRNRHSEVQEVVAEGNRVVARLHWTVTAAVDGPGWRAGSAVHSDYVDFCTVEDGLIVEYLGVFGPMLPEAPE